MPFVISSFFPTEILYGLADVTLARFSANLYFVFIVITIQQFDTIPFFLFLFMVFEGKLHRAVGMLSAISNNSINFILIKRLLPFPISLANHAEVKASKLKEKIAPSISLLYIIITQKNDARHEKTDLKVFAIVIPKEGWTRVAAPILLLV